MRKTLLFFLILTVVFYLHTTGLGKYSGGTGDITDPYLIATAEDLNDIGNHPNDWTWGNCFLLTKDINMAGVSDEQFRQIELFQGVFDGDNHTIYNLTMINPDSDFVGLFKEISSVDPPRGKIAQIKNLILANPLIDAGTGIKVGALAGQVDSGKITNCKIINGTVRGDGYIGAMVGKVEGDIVFENCSAHANVFGTGNYVGGLIGYINSSNYLHQISNCHTAGLVKAYNYVGGLIGLEQDDVIENCYSTAEVNGVDFVGGLMGKCEAVSIEKCYSAGKVFAKGNYSGGLLGECYYTTITNCYWDIEASGQDTSSGGAGKTTKQMKQQDTFAGWDFTNETINGNRDIWTINEHADYPKLTFERTNLDSQGKVDFVDFSILIRNWLNDCPVRCGACDLNKDNRTDIKDYTIFAYWWGKTNCGSCGSAEYTGDSSVDNHDLKVWTACWLSKNFDCDGRDIDFSGSVDYNDLQILCNYWLR